MYHFDYSNKAKVNKIIQDYKNGEDVPSMQRKFHVSAGTIYRILDMNGVPRRAKHGRKTYDALDRFTDKELHQIVAEHDAGLPLVDIYYKWDINKNAFYVIQDKVRAMQNNEVKNLWELVE